MLHTALDHIRQMMYVCEKNTHKRESKEVYYIFTTKDVNMCERWVHHYDDAHIPHTSTQVLQIPNEMTKDVNINSGGRWTLEDDDSLQWL